MRDAVWLLWVCMLAGSARAQPQGPNCYSPDRLGWAGPGVEIGCQPCCGCRSTAYDMEWQVRDEAAAWAVSPQTFSVAGRYINSPFTGLTHGARYCTRVRFSDDAGPGQWGPSNTPSCGVGSDVCFQWDSAPPTTPQLLDGGAVPGSGVVELHFAPSSDDGGGVARYFVRYQPGGTPAVGSFGRAVTSPVTDLVGAGTWTLSVSAEDLATNTSPGSALLTVSVGFDAAVAPAPAPAWAAVMTNLAYLELVWSDDGADSWVVNQRAPDGGWFIGARPRVSGPAALLAVPGPCRLHAGRIARVLADQVSAWSPPSSEVLADTVAPVASSPRLSGVDGGGVLLDWSAATDGCPSGLTYRLQRSVNGSAFVTRATTNATQAFDALDATGLLTWRLVVVDGAGNLGTSDGGVSLQVDADAGAPDAGEVDAGEVDAGEVDAGEVDAGTTPEDPAARALSVGCGCAGLGDAGVWWVMLLLLAPRLRGAASSTRAALRVDPGKVRRCAFNRS